MLDQEDLQDLQEWFETSFICWLIYHTVYIIIHNRKRLVNVVHRVKEDQKDLLEQLVLQEKLARQVNLVLEVLVAYLECLDWLDLLYNIFIDFL